MAMEQGVATLRERQDAVEAAVKVFAPLRNTKQKNTRPALWLVPALNHLCPLFQACQKYFNLKFCPHRFDCRPIQWSQIPRLGNPKKCDPRLIFKKKPVSDAAILSIKSNKLLRRILRDSYEKWVCFEYTCDCTCSEISLNDFFPMLFYFSRNKDILPFYFLNHKKISLVVPYFFAALLSVSRVLTCLTTGTSD